MRRCYHRPRSRRVRSWFTHRATRQPRHRGRSRWPEIHRHPRYWGHCRTYCVAAREVNVAHFSCFQEEKGVDAQKRLIKEFYETVEDYDPQ